MIRADRGDIAKPVAELALFFVRAKGRRTFSDGAELFHVVLRQNQIVRTSFAGHVDPAGARFGDDRYATPATHMHDVQPTAGFRGELDRDADRLEFRGDRS